MKKQASPVPTPRAAALSQSASRYAAGAASAWQNIAGNSARLADANRRANGPSYAPLSPGQAVPPEDSNRRLPAPARPTMAPGQRPEPEETIRQVGWREVERAVSASTKRKYSFLGIGFGSKVPVFESEKMTVPVYQETDRNKRYYAAVKQKNVARVKREGLQPEFGGPGTSAAPQTVGQFNSQGHIYFFSNEASAQHYGQKSIDSDYAIIEFIMPEYQEIIPEWGAELGANRLTSIPQTLRTEQSISAAYIKVIKGFRGNTPSVFLNFI